MTDLRASIFIDQLQPQTLAYVSTWMRGSLPRARMAAQIIEIAPGLDIEALTAHMPRIDLLKCDIEGSEEVFVTTYAGFFKRVQAAVFELHPTICDVPACRKVLAEAGLTEVTVLRLAGDQSVELFERP